MDTYEQKYKEALSIAKEIYNRPDATDGGKIILESMFPELRESEDEMIKKELIQYLKDYPNLPNGNYCRNDFFAWLEKQGSSNPYSGTSFDYNGHTWGMCAREGGVDILCDSQLIKHIEKRGEQKSVEQDTETRDLWEYIGEWRDKFGRLPKDEDELAACIDYVMKRQKSSWSEKDEKMLKSVISSILISRGSCEEDDDVKDKFDNEISWLKSLKPNHWKPSEEQMQALWNAIPHIPNSEKDIDTITELSALYEELKSL